MNDIYVYPNTNVLINNLGIKDEEILKKAESDFTVVRLKELLDKKDFVYEVSSYLETHRYMFQDIYPFAGNIRKIDIEKRERVLSNMPMLFTSYEKVMEELTRVFKSKKVDFSSSSETIVQSIIDFMTSVWEIHPFREGNTRSIITYTMKYMKSNNLKFDDQVLLNNFSYIRDALVMSVYKNPQYLETILLDAIEKGKKL